MADNVVPLSVVTSLDLPPERLLQAAIDEGLSEVVIVGFKKDGEEYFASSVADGGSVLWNLERAKLRLLRTPDDPSFPRSSITDPEGKVLQFEAPIAMPKEPA